MIGIATGHWALLCQRPRLHFGIGNRSVVGACLGASVIITAAATAATSAAAAATTVVAFPLRKRKEINRYTLVMRSKRTNAKAGTRSMDVDSCVNADIVAMTFSDISCCCCCCFYWRPTGGRRPKASLLFFLALALCFSFDFRSKRPRSFKRQLVVTAAPNRR